MRICIDLDGVVAQLRTGGESYEQVQPVPGAVDGVRSLREAGHTIILFTARHMRTCGGNQGLVMARQGRSTLNWLHQHGIEFDEIHFGKPHADVYIDDNGYRFSRWGDIDSLGIALPQSQESVRDSGQ